MAGQWIPMTTHEEERWRFGFVVANDGEKDVFIHISVVEKAGIRMLAEGQRVSMRVAKTQKGREAISVALVG